MKEKELREHASCFLCKEKIGEHGIPLFWRVKVERFGLQMKAISRQTGLAMFLNPTLAKVMGPDEDMAKVIHENTIVICETCCTSSTCVATLAGFD